MPENTPPGPDGIGPARLHPSVRRNLKPIPAGLDRIIRERARRGHPVLRTQDLLSLRVELVNLRVTPVTEPDKPPRLERAGSDAAYLILHFPPQAIAEQVFFDPKSEMPKCVDGNSDRRGAELPGDELKDLEKPQPVRARLAGESRLAFVVPDGFSCDYTLKGLLDACKELELSVAPTATSRTARPLVRRVILSSLAGIDPGRLAPGLRTTLLTAALRSLRVRSTDKAEDSPVLALREAAAGRAASSDIAVMAPHHADLASALASQRTPPLAPTATQTAIEVPLRLILSPNRRARFVHSSEPAQSLLTSRVELWHTRLAVRGSDGSVSEAPGGNKTLRAVWMRSGDSSDGPFNADWQGTGDRKPQPDNQGQQPFRMTLDDNDRFSIVHASSNFRFANYTPAPIDCNTLMLSSLGAWLDSRGAWSPPPGLSVEEWVHRATMGRDHYVRVVYKGYLFPCGHRASLVKVSERRFHHDRPGSPAFLRQRMYIVVREPERTYTRTDLHCDFIEDGEAFKRFYHRQFPFPRVRITTTVTPNLQSPTDWPSQIQNTASSPPEVSQNMFWPCVGSRPFGFHMVATDLDGRTVEFVLPQIFISDELAAPAKTDNGQITVDQGKATPFFKVAQDAWLAKDGERRDWRKAVLNFQRVALAPSAKPGDTASEIEQIEFGAEVDNLTEYAEQEDAPQCYPSILSAVARIPAVAQLAGSTAVNTLTWPASYLHHGFDPPDAGADAKQNPGQVFLKVAGEGALDFTKQGNRSGGLVMPNLVPTALSRLSGPISGDVKQFAQEATLDPLKFFEKLSPLLFGCIPLSKVVMEVTGLDQHPEKLPKFVSEAATKIEALFSEIGRVFEIVVGLAKNVGDLVEALVKSAVSSLLDLAAQAITLAKAQLDAIESAVKGVQVALEALSGSLKDKLAAVATAIETATTLADQPAPDIRLELDGTLWASVTSALSELERVVSGTVVGPLPASLKQNALSHIQQLRGFLEDVQKLPSFIDAAVKLKAALDPLLDPKNLGDLFEDPLKLVKLLPNAKQQLSNILSPLNKQHLIDGAPKQIALAVVNGLLDTLTAFQKLSDLLGEELVVRFDWRPEIRPVPKDAPIFRPNDKNGLVVSIEARMKRNGQSTPKVQVLCGLNHFDLVLIGEAAFLELLFEKIEFRADSSLKMNVDVQLKDIRFVGCLSFVETLRDLIPLDGFSDPPALDISEKGIDASFSLALPNLALGIFSLTNLSLGAGFTVPFIGQPLSVRFNFCTREQPFNLTVSLFGGGGFFGITIDPQGVQLLEAAFEFGASLSLDFGVASGGVHVMAGVYFRMEREEASLTGYFRLGGSVSVLGLISASIELYMELRYEFETGKCIGRAQLTIEVEVFLFSLSVTIECERKFAGSNGDPTFAQLMGPPNGNPLDDPLYPWREYCEAFA